MKPKFMERSSILRDRSKRNIYRMEPEMTRKQLIRKAAELFRGKVLTIKLGTGCRIQFDISWIEGIHADVGVIDFISFPQNLNNLKKCDKIDWTPVIKFEKEIQMVIKESDKQAKEAKENKKDYWQGVLEEAYELNKKRQN